MAKHRQNRTLPVIDRKVEEIPRTEIALRGTEKYRTKTVRNNKDIRQIVLQTTPATTISVRYTNSQYKGEKCRDTKNRKLKNGS